MRTICLLALALAVVACASADITRTGKEYESRPDDWPISVYASGTAPPEVARIAQSGSPQGKQIGRIRVRGPKTIEWHKLVNKGRSAAREMGGDEVMFTKGDVYLRWIEGRVYRRGE